jgi:RHS repeat-associated protein
MIKASGESGSEDYRYTGKHEDTTGLYYFVARSYDPDTGRFITRDTVFGVLSDPQSLNRYSYCRNNPHKYTDPTGHIFETLIDLGSAYLSYREWKENPSAWNTAMLAVDVAAVVVPFVPAVGWIGKADDIGDAAKAVKELAEHSDEVYDLSKYADEVVEASEKFAKYLGDPLPSPSHTTHSRIMNYADEADWANGLRNEVSEGLIDIQAGGGNYKIYYQPAGKHAEGAVIHNTKKGWVSIFDNVRGFSHYPMSEQKVMARLNDGRWLDHLP